MSRKSPKKAKRNRRETYRVSVLKSQDDYSLDAVLAWIKENGTGDKFYYRDYKKNIVFTFYNIDDAFKFKFRWEVAN